MSLIGVAIILFVCATVAIGVRTHARIQGHATNYYVAGNAMPVWVVGIALSAGGFDANGSMGNASLAHADGFWAGAVIPFGIAGCLFITGAVVAAPLHRMHLLTLADFYRRRFSSTTETLAALSMLASNIILIAGNLAGLGLLLDLVFGAGYLLMMIIIGACILAYAVTGGLYAAITTSVLQVGVFAFSTVLAFAWFVGTYGWGPLMAAVPPHLTDLSGLVNRDAGALVNWASLVSLALGDVVAIDFIQRVLSADSVRSARRGCYIAGTLALTVGALVSFIGLFAHYFGTAPSRFLLVELAVEELPVVLATILLLGVIATSMSTAAAVMLALANLVTRNLLQRHSRRAWTDKSLLRLSRWLALPTMTVAIAFAYVRPEPGVLLILAFDVVLASCFVPLILGLFWARTNSAGAIAAIAGGAGARLGLQFVVAEGWAGADTIVAALVSLLLCVSVSRATGSRVSPNHEALNYVASDAELVDGTF